MIILGYITFLAVVIIFATAMGLLFRKNRRANRRNPYLKDKDGF